MRHLDVITVTPQHDFLTILWLLAQHDTHAPPITAGMIVTAVLFVVWLVWFVVSVLGLAH